MSATPAPPRDVWVDQRLAVRDSPINGRGLFARSPVPEGTVVVRLSGRLVNSSEPAGLIAAADSDPGATYVDTITVDEDKHLVLPSGTHVHYGNHSCDPTLWHVGRYELATRRELRPGDEATIDYGTHTSAQGFVMVCRCRSKHCRGSVTSDDWRLPELQ